MKVVKTELEGVLIIEPRLFNDSRGYFFESFNAREFAALTGYDIHFVQDNESRSTEGVVRGLHFQLPPHAQSKLVRVITGTIIDIAVDIRRGSPTFGQHVAVELSADNHRQLFIPRGFAHGFIVKHGDAIVQYKCDNLYAPDAERAIIWNDEKLAIDWGIASAEAIISDKDALNPSLDECDTLFDYNTDYYA
jgi:dTDP-4-dehydrorhamnose 3,5-epimerase